VKSHAAKYIPYGDPRTHRPLAELLPLEAPLSVFVDPSSLCNLECEYCPTGRAVSRADQRRSRGKMEFDLFRKIIDDLARFPYPLQRLHLYKDGEPLLNVRLAEMVKAAKQRNIASSVELTTNGLCLTRERAQALIRAGLDRIRISVQTPYGIRSRAGDVGHVYERVRGNVEVLWQEKERWGSVLHVHVKTLDFELPRSDVERFHRDFSNIADSIHIDAPMGWSLSAGFDYSLGSNPATDMSRGTALDRERVVCPHPFYSLAINHDGLVSACCVDWSEGAIIGDVRMRTLSDIWRGEALREFRMAHLGAMRHKIPVCGSCEYVWGASQASTLDANRAELLRSYSGG
jgi:MoaA/NifB/PqqE/SkfB family radical SAM enzyme